jgi:large subunit ribosomal protein L31e
VPFRVRVKLSRKHNDDEDAKEKTYTLVTVKHEDSFHGLKTLKADNDDEE